MEKSNIEKFNESLTPEERKQRAIAAGVASGEARRKSRRMKDSLSSLLYMSLKSGEVADIDQIKSLAELKGQNISVLDAGVLALVQRYIKGDPAAFSIVQEMVGEKPSANINISGSVNNPFEGLTVEELKKLASDE